MNFVKRRQQTPAHFHSDAYGDQRLREVANERCGQCWDRWPKSVLKDEDGKRRCPDCLDTTSAEWKARVDAHDAAMLATKQTKPQDSNAPLNDSEPPHIRIMTNAAGTRINQSNPLGLVRSGSAVTLTLTGGGFVSTDAFTYSAEIEDDVAPALSGTTIWTLTLIATGAASPGLNHLYFNNHIYRNIFMVG